MKDGAIIANSGHFNVEIDLEEAYLTMSPIPWVGEYVPLGLQLGRKFMNFGILNPIHPHQASTSAIHQ